jgi:hypothetical protein
MTCLLSNASTLRARAEAVWSRYQGALSRGDATRGKALWTAYRDADAAAYAAEREQIRSELEARYPLA